MLLFLNRSKNFRRESGAVMTWQSIHDIKG
jgi:hypothetical protein